MIEFLKAAFSALPAVSASPYALVAYIVVIAAWVIISWRVKRNANLLQNLQKLPPRDRLKALQAEMGAVQLASGLTPEQWLRGKMHFYYFLGFAILFLSFVVLFVVAAVSQLSGTIYLGIGIIAFAVLVVLVTASRLKPAGNVDVDITPFNDGGGPV